MPIWVRGRGFATGEMWCVLEPQGSLTESTPGAEVLELTRALDPTTPSVVLARLQEDTWLTAATGFRTAQQRVNTSNVCMSVAVIDSETRCRRLAAALIHGLLQSPELSLGHQLGHCVIDGVDTVTFRVTRDFMALLSQALDNDPTLGPVVKGALVLGEHARTSHTLQAAAALAAPGAPLPAVPVPVLVTGEPRRDALRGRSVGVSVTAGGPEPTPGAPDPQRPVTPNRIVQSLVNAMVLGGVVFTSLALLIAVRVTLDLAETARKALGLHPPLAGVDWFLVVVGAIMAIVPCALLLAGRWVLRSRFNDRLLECCGALVHPRRFPLPPSTDRVAWLTELLETPFWRQRAEDWRASHKLTAPRSGWSEADYRQAAALVAQELSFRVGHRALATGLAVAVAQRRLSDAAAIIAGSAEIQVDSLASLGLRPTARGWLHAGRAAATGLLFATYVDVEERFEVKLAVQAAAFGLEGLGDVFEITGDLVSDTAEEVFSETVGAAGGVVGTAGALLGVSLGVSGNLAQQVGEFIAKGGADIAEGVVIAAVLHYHGMSLVATALALNEEHRAELAPRLGRIPSELTNAAKDLASRQTAQFRALLRQRTKALPRIFRDLLSRRRAGRVGDRGQAAPQKAVLPWIR